VCDGLSCTVLTLGLRPRGGSVVARAAELHADAGEPYVMMLRSLTAPGLTFAPQTVFVCENPAVVSAAAERLGASSPPLVCSGGWPNTAVTTLLEAPSAGGGQLRVQGDGDGEGQATHAHLRRQHGAVPWLADGERIGVQEEDVAELLLDEARRSAWLPHAP
jgi:uncharacterized protein (TIGR02679 family)